MLAEGYFVVTTVINGDCAFDVMIAYLGESREPSRILFYRYKIASVVRELVGNVVWESCFTYSGEGCTRAEWLEMSRPKLSKSVVERLRRNARKYSLQGPMPPAKAP